MASAAVTDLAVAQVFVESPGAWESLHKFFSKISDFQFAAICVAALGLCVCFCVCAYCAGKRKAANNLADGVAECPQGHALRRRSCKETDACCEWCGREKPLGSFMWVCKRCPDRFMICEDCLPYLGQDSAGAAFLEMGVMPMNSCTSFRSARSGVIPLHSVAGAFKRRREIEFVMHAPKKVDKKAEKGSSDFPDLMFCSMDEALHWLESKIRKLARQGDCPDVPLMIWEQNMLIVDNNGEKYECYDQVPEMSQNMFPLLFWYGFYPEGCEADEAGMRMSRESQWGSRSVQSSLRKTRDTALESSRSLEVLEDARCNKPIAQTGHAALDVMYQRQISPLARYGSNTYKDPKEAEAKFMRIQFAKRIARFFAIQQKTMQVQMRMDLLEVVDVDEVTQEELERQVERSLRGDPDSDDELEVDADAAAGSRLPESPELVTCMPKKTAVSIPADSVVPSADTQASKPEATVHRAFRVNSVLAAWQGSVPAAPVDARTSSGKPKGLQGLARSKSNDAAHRSGSRSTPATASSDAPSTRLRAHTGFPAAKMLVDSIMSEDVPDDVPPADLMNTGRDQDLLTEGPCAEVDLGACESPQRHIKAMPSFGSDVSEQPRNESDLGLPSLVSMWEHSRGKQLEVDGVARVLRGSCDAASDTDISAMDSMLEGSLLSYDESSATPEHQAGRARSASVASERPQPAGGEDDEACFMSWTGAEGFPTEVLGATFDLQDMSSVDSHGSDETRERG